MPESDYYLARLEARRLEQYESLKSGVELNIMQREGWRWDTQTDKYVSAREVSQSPETTEREKKGVLEDFRRFIEGKKGKDGTPQDAPIPTLINPKDESFNFWGPNESTDGGDLFGDSPKAPKTDAPKAPAPAPVAPAPNDQVESIFDE
jgi:hypothetical protein